MSNNRYTTTFLQGTSCLFILAAAPMSAPIDAQEFQSQEPRAYVARASSGMDFPTSYSTIVLGEMVDSFEEELSKFFSNLLEEQKSLPEDMAKLLSDNFWDLA